MAILEKEIDIKVTPRNVTYRKSKDYKVIVGDIVNVKIHDLKNKCCKGYQDMRCMWEGNP